MRSETSAPAPSSRSSRQAARSRSEADWIVGMNATRAATIRLRSSFDGAVSLGRVQTPTLAILARREEEIRAFKPEPYWVVDASFDGARRARTAAPTRAGSTPAPSRGWRPPRKPRRSSPPARGRPARSRSSRSARARSARRSSTTSHRCSRDASKRFGFFASRTLPAAQRLYEEHKALTYPRTNSRFITSDMIGDIKPIARAASAAQPEYAAASSYVLGLDVLPLARVVNDEKVTDHHAIIPTNAERHPVDKMNEDDRKIYDLVVRRFLAVFHPEAVSENTRVETTVAAHVFRTRGKLLLVPGWRGVYGETADLDEPPGRGRRRRAAAPEAEQGRERRGSRRRLDAQGDQAAASLQRQLAAGSDGDRRPARRRRGAARGDEGIGDRHTRHARRDHRTPAPGRLHRARRPRAGRHREGPERDPACSASTRSPRPGLTGDWEHRLAKIETGADSREAFMGDIVKFTAGDRRRARREAEGRPDPARQPRPVPGLRARHRREPQGLFLLVARGSGLRIRHLEVEGRQAAAARGRARADQDRTHREAGHRASRPRSGKSFRSRLALSRPRTASGASSSTSRGRRRAPSRLRWKSVVEQTIAVAEEAQEAA